MWPTNWSPIEHEAAGLLLRCQGLIGQSWSYSTSHGQLLVRFYREGSLDGIYLYCKACRSVRFESVWHDARPKLEPSGGDGAITVSDGERLVVTCGAAFLAEGLELIHLPDPTI